MQKWLDGDEILIYLTHNEGKSVVTERFIRTLKGKSYRKMIANDRKYYPTYLNKLVDEYNNTYHSSIGKKLLMLSILFRLNGVNQVIKLLNIKLVMESG